MASMSHLHLRSSSQTGTPPVCISDHAYSSSKPVIDAEGVVALQQSGIAALMPDEQTGAGPSGGKRRVGEHGERLLHGELAAAQTDHADACADIVIQHDDGILPEMSQHPVAQR